MYLREGVNEGKLISKLSKIGVVRGLKHRYDLGFVS